MTDDVANWAPDRFEHRRPTRDEMQALAASTLDQIPRGILDDVWDDDIAEFIAAYDVTSWEPGRFEKRRPTLAEVRALAPYPIGFRRGLLIGMTERDLIVMSTNVKSEADRAETARQLLAAAAELPDDDEDDSA
jgi:hypothetical protein